MSGAGRYASNGWGPFPTYAGIRERVLQLAEERGLPDYVARLDEAVRLAGEQGVGVYDDGVRPSPSSVVEVGCIAYTRGSLLWRDGTT